MKRLTILLLLLLPLFAGCQTLGSLNGVDSEPHATKERPCELVVKVRAEARKGLRRLSIEGNYGDTVKERADERIKRVNYERMADIVVVVEGPGYELAAPADEIDPPEIVLTDEGFSRDMAAVMLAHPRHDKVAEKVGESGESKSMTDLAKAMWLGMPVSFTNNRSKAVTLYGTSADHSFELTIAPGKNHNVYISKPGEYVVECDDNDTWHCTLIASESPFMRNARAGDDLKFFLPEGNFTVKVYAPRLPVWSQTISVKSNKMSEVAATLGVNSLPKQK